MDQIEFPNICYYTFLDVSMDFYVSLNSNFIELTHRYQYFVLVSGKNNGKPYSDFLKTILGPNTVYIECDQNIMTKKFNLFKNYLISHQSVYNNTIFCKIDTDLVHYNVEEFHKKLYDKFSKNKNIFIGVIRDSWVRGGLNAIHYQSIVKCDLLPEDYKWNEFDIIFSTLMQKNLVQFCNDLFFDQSEHINVKTYATHTSSQRLSSDKRSELLSLINQLETQKIKI